MITVYVHDGTFHADDVICVALIKMVHNDVIVKRERILDAKSIEPGLGEVVYVLDTGKRDIVDEEKGLIAFDHHSMLKICYNSGVMYAACGKLFGYLVAKQYFDHNIDYDEMKKIIKIVFWPVEVQDNGQNIAENNPKLKLGPNLFSWVSAFNASWDENPCTQNQRFNDAVDIAIKILEREFDRIHSSMKVKNLIQKDIDKRTNTSILVLDKFLPWQESVIEFNDGYKDYKDKIKLVIFENMSGQYNVQGVPLFLGSLNTLAPIPEDWRDKSDENLAEVTGIEDSIFAHRGAHMAIFGTKESALKAAEIILAARAPMPCTDLLD